jgi:hypothetical protein
MDADTVIKSSSPSEVKPAAELHPGRKPLRETNNGELRELPKETMDEAADQQPESKSDRLEELAAGEPGTASEMVDELAANGAKNPKDNADDESEIKYKEPLPAHPAKSQNEKKSVKAAAGSNKIIISTLILFMIAGAGICSKPILSRLKQKPEKAVAAQTAIEKPAEQAQIQTRQPEPSGKNDRYLSKLEEVDRLREELLAKKEEIYRLKLHYSNGIAELKAQIGQEMQDVNISSFQQALRNKRIELNLRTIQRRQVYIQKLEKPDRWLHNASEELLFLKRKALLDLQMTDIASGIDLDRQMRDLNAAIQKYQPSADKLAVDPHPGEITPLETIWSQIFHQQAENVQIPVGVEDEKIIVEICSGNYGRIAQLTAITPQAAMCLARMSGSDLFLNGLTQLTPKEAKHLFQWQGDWICLNSVKTLSPAVAKYLFTWQGNWISLNGLTQFPPELALYLMEWKGNQLELMGLQYEKVKPDQRTLKYLALWETMGGKLFVPDDIRDEMNRVI